LDPRNSDRTSPIAAGSWTSSGAEHGCNWGVPDRAGRHLIRDAVPALRWTGMYSSRSRSPFGLATLVCGRQTCFRAHPRPAELVWHAVLEAAAGRPCSFEDYPPPGRDSDVLRLVGQSAASQSGGLDQRTCSSTSREGEARASGARVSGVSPLTEPTRVTAVDSPTNRCLALNCEKPTRMETTARVSSDLGVWHGRQWRTNQTW